MIRFNEMIEKMENMNSYERLQFLKEEMKKLKQETSYLTADREIEKSKVKVKKR